MLRYIQHMCIEYVRSKLCLLTFLSSYTQHINQQIHSVQYSKTQITKYNSWYHWSCPLQGMCYIRLLEGSTPVPKHVGVDTNEFYFMACILVYCVECISVSICWKFSASNLKVTNLLLSALLTTCWEYRPLLLFILFFYWVTWHNFCHMSANATLFCSEHPVYSS